MRSRLLDLAIACLWLPLASATWTAWRAHHAPLAIPLLAENLLIIGLFVVRRPTRQVARDPMAWFLAIVGTVAPLMMRPALGVSPMLAFASLGLQALAIAGLLASLAWLGRSFGVVAAHRGLVREGPYGMVRHPLYACEMAFYCAFLLGNPGTQNAGVLAVCLMTQILRARQEEHLLRADLRYRNYARLVRFRFIPGVV